jgi:hypothetical protein
MERETILLTSDTSALSSKELAKYLATPLVNIITRFASPWIKEELIKDVIGGFPNINYNSFDISKTELMKYYNEDPDMFDYLKNYNWEGMKVSFKSDDDFGADPIWRLFTKEQVISTDIKVVKIVFIRRIGKLRDYQVVTIGNGRKKTIQNIAKAIQVIVKRWIDLVEGIQNIRIGSYDQYYGQSRPVELDNLKADRIVKNGVLKIYVEIGGIYEKSKYE